MVDDYLELLEMWLGAFARSRLFVGFLEDFAADAPRFMDGIVAHAGIPAILKLCTLHEPAQHSSPGTKPTPEMDAAV